MFPNRDLDFLYELVSVEDGAGDHDCKLFDQIKLVSGDKLLHPPVDALVIYRAGELVGLGRFVEVEIHCDVDFVAASEAMFFLVDAVMGIKDGIYESYRPHMGSCKFTHRLKSEFVQESGVFGADVAVFSGRQELGQVDGAIKPQNTVATHPMLVQ